MHEYIWVNRTYYHRSEPVYWYIKAKWILGPLWRRKVQRPLRRMDIWLLDLDNEQKENSTVF